jgi:hypothetical protein
LFAAIVPQQALRHLASGRIARAENQYS